jgi:hypothetical protein
VLHKACLAVLSYATTRLNEQHDIQQQWKVLKPLLVQLKWNEMLIITCCLWHLTTKTQHMQTMREVQFDSMHAWQMTPYWHVHRKMSCTNMETSWWIKTQVQIMYTYLYFIKTSKLQSLIFVNWGSDIFTVITILHFLWKKREVIHDYTLFHIILLIDRTQDMFFWTMNEWSASIINLHPYHHHQFLLLLSGA